MKGYVLVMKDSAETTINKLAFYTTWCGRMTRSANKVIQNNHDTVNIMIR